MNSTRPWASAWVDGGRRVGRLLGRVEQFEHSLGGGDAGLQHVDHRGRLGERLRELTRVLDEGLHVAETQRAVGHLQAAEDGDGDVVEVADHHHRRLHAAADELGCEAGLVELVVGGVEAGLRLALAAERLHDRVAGERLLDLRVERAGVLPLGDELALRVACDPLHQHQRDGHGDDGDDGQLPRDPQHHRDGADDGEHALQQLAERLLHALRDVVDVVGDAAEQVAAGLTVEVRQRHRVQLRLHVGAQAVHRALHHAGQHVRLQVRQRVAGEVQADGKPERGVQRGEVDARRRRSTSAPDLRRSGWWRAPGSSGQTRRARR